MNKLIENTTNYFISDEGYCFKIVDGREKIIKSFVSNGILKVHILNERNSIIDLMVKYFIGLENVDHHSRIQYKKIDDRIPLKHIKIKRSDVFDSKDEQKMFIFKCQEKATGNNCRVKNEYKLTKEDIYSSLQRTNFECFYCGAKLNSTWELDHVVPISKGGKNISTNIIPSCKICNRMKGALLFEKFISQSNRISENNSDNERLPKNNIIKDLNNKVENLKLEIDFLNKQLDSKFINKN